MTYERDEFVDKLMDNIMKNNIISGIDKLLTIAFMTIFLIGLTNLAIANDTGSGNCVVPYKGMTISSNTQLCFGNYSLSTNNNGQPHILGLSHGDIIINNDNIILDCNGSPIYGVGIGIENNGHKNVTIRNCEIYGYSKGIYFYNDATGAIENNSFFNNEFNIYSDSSSLNVINNRLFGGKYGIYSTHGSTINAEDNNIFNTDYGIYLTGPGNTITNNHFSSNEFHIFIDADSYTDCDNDISHNDELNNIFDGHDILYYNSKVDLSNIHAAELILCNADYSNINNVTIMSADANSSSNGIVLIQTDFANITGSDSRYNYIGISLYSSTNNTITNNYFDHNGDYGIFTDINSKFNTFYNNHVCEGNGTYDIYDETDNDNAYSDNYCDSKFVGVASGSCAHVCSGFTCQDIDRDGYGVCPHCNITNGCLFDGNDCADYDPTRPMIEDCSNSIDDDCDGLIDNDDPDCWYVDLDDPSTWDPDNDGISNVENVSGEYLIDQDVRLVNKIYNIPSNSPAISINCDNCVLDCNGAIINGTGYGQGIVNDGHDNITIKNCYVNNYNIGIDFVNDSDNNHLTDNHACGNNIDIHLSSDSNNNIGDNIFGTLDDEDSNSIIQSDSCFSLSHCVDFSNPATWDYNGNGLSDIVQEDYYVYRIVESTKVCPNHQDFIKLTVDDNVTMTCGIGSKSKSSYYAGEDSAANTNKAKGTEQVALVLNNNSVIDGCNFAADSSQLRVLINGDSAKLLNNIFFNFSIDVNGSGAQIIGNKIHSSNTGISAYSNDNLIFDNDIDGEIGYESYSGSSVAACNRMTTTTGANLYGGDTVFEYNKLISTNGINVSGGTGSLLYNIINADNGITGTGEYQLRGNILDYRFGVISLDWSGPEAEFYDNAFCSGSVSHGSGVWDDNYCQATDCQPCEIFDTRYKDLTCPYEYSDGKLTVIMSPPEYDYSEDINGTTYYVKEVYTDEDLNCKMHMLNNMIYPTADDWSLESNGLLLKTVSPMNESVNLDSLYVDYLDSYPHNETSKGNSYLCKAYVNKSYVDGAIHEKFVVMNSPPQIIALHPSNASTLAAGDITLWVETYDPDNDTLTYEYHVIYPNGTEIINHDINYTYAYQPGEYEWYVDVSDGSSNVESEHYEFTVYRTIDVLDMMFEPVSNGSMPDAVDTLDDLRCRVRVNGTYGLDYDGVQFIFYVNGSPVYDELVTTPNADWFAAILSHDNTTKHDNVTCEAYAVWDNGLGSYSHLPGTERNTSLLVENTPPEITSMSPDNHTSLSEYLPEGNVHFDINTSDVDSDSVACHIIIDGVDGISYHNESDSATCEFDVQLSVGQYEWYVIANDGDNSTISETRHLNIAPLRPHVDDVILTQLNGVRSYWETYDDMLVNITLSNYSSYSTAVLFIGNNCTYVSSPDNYSCVDVITNENISCGTGNCQYILSHGNTTKHDNLTIYVRAETYGTWNMISDNDWHGNVYINNIPPEFINITPDNDSVFTIFDNVRFDYPADDLDNDSLNYVLHVYHDGALIWAHEGPENGSDKGSPYSPGNYTWNVIVSDGDNQTVSETRNFIVVDPRPSGNISVDVGPVPGTGYTDSRIDTFDDIECNVTVDGDADYLIIKWLRNGVEISNEQVPYGDIIKILSHDNTTKHDNITCEAIPVTDYSGSKGYYYGDAVSDYVIVQNILPAVPELVSPANASTLRDTNVTLTANYIDPDPDGDDVSIHYYIRSVLDTTYNEVNSPIQLDYGAYEWYARAYDGEEYSNESAHWTFIISSAVILPPIDNLTIEPQPVYTTSNMTCSADLQGLDEDVNVTFNWQTWNGTDWVDTGYEWTYDLLGDESWHHYETPPISGMNHHDQWRCVVSMNDSAIDFTITDIKNSAPFVELVSPPDNSVSDSPVELLWTGSDADNDPLNYSVYVNGEQVYVGADTSYEYDATTIPGDYEWYVIARDGDDMFESEHWTFTTVEFPCPFVDIIPNEPNKNDDLFCNVSGDVASLSSMFGTVYADIKWYKNGEFSGEGDNLACDSATGCESILSHELTSPGDNWTFTARYYIEYNNTDYFGNCMTNDTVMIINHLPSIDLIQPEDYAHIGIYSPSDNIIHFEWSGNDEDDDPLSYTLHYNTTGGDESVINMNGFTTYDISLPIGAYEWYVIADDGYGITESEHWHFKIVPMYPCELSMHISNAIEGEPIRVDMNVSNNIRTLSHEWGTPIIASLHCSDNNGDEYNCTEDAFDGCQCVIPADKVQAGDNWTCSYYLQRDWYNDDNMSCIINDSIIVQPNQPPMIVLVSPENNTQSNITTESESVEFTWDGNDADGQELFYKLHVTPVGSFDEITPTLEILWAGQDENYTADLRPGIYEWYVIADDGHNITESEHWFIEIFPDMGCEHWLRVDPEPVYEGDETHIVLYTAPNIAERVREDWGVDDIAYTITCKDLATGDVIAQQCEDNDYEKFDLALPGLTAGQEIYCEGYLSTSCDEERLSCMTNKSFSVSVNHAPSIELISPEDGNQTNITTENESVEFTWHSEDPDDDTLSYMFHIQPIYYYGSIETSPEQDIETTDEYATVDLRPGIYEWYVNVTDGREIVESEHWTVYIFPDLGCGITIDRSPDIVYSGNEVHIIAHYDDEMLQRAEQWGAEFTGIVECSDDLGHHEYGTTNPAIGDTHTAKINITEDDVVEGAEWECRAFGSLNADTPFSCIVNDTFTVGNAPPEVYLVSPENDSEFMFAEDAAKTVQLQWHTDDPEGEPVRCMLHITNIDTDEEYERDVDVFPWINFNLAVYFDTVDGMYEWYVNCSDGTNEVESEHWFFDVNVNHDPTVELISPDCGSEIEAGPDGSVDVTFEWDGHDDDGDELTYNLNVNGLNVPIGSDESYTMEELTPGEYDWYVTVDDGVNPPVQSSSCHLTITEFHNDPPVVSDVTIFHHPPPVNPDDLRGLGCAFNVTDPDNDEVNATVKWYINGEYVEGYDWTGTCLANGEGCMTDAELPQGLDDCTNTTCEAQAYDGYDYSEPVNSSVWSNWDDSCGPHEDAPPEIVSMTAHSVPSGPSSPEVMRCYVVVNDSDDDEVTVDIRWYHNGTYVSDYDGVLTCQANGVDDCDTSELDNPPAPDLSNNCDIWTCEAQANDGELYSDAMNASWGNWDDSCNTENHAPTVELVSPDDEQLFCAHELNMNYEWDGNDADGDTLSYDLHIINPDGDDEVITTSDENANHWVTSEGVHEWYIVADDGHDMIESVHRHFEVLAQPVISLSSSNPDGSTITPGQEIRFSVITSSDDITYAWDDSDYAPVVCSEPLYKYLYICSVDAPDDLESGEHHLHIIASNNGEYGACSDDESYTFNVGSDENHAPVVTLTNPVDGYEYSVSSGDECPHIGMTWDVYDEDGDTVSCELHILGPDDLGDVVKERDPGVNYYYNNLCSVFGVSNPDGLGGTYEWYVNCSDGENEVESEHREFMVTVSGENHPPQVTLISPEQWQVFELSDDEEKNIHFEWSTYDDDGDTITSELHILNDNTGEEWEYDVGTGASFDWTAPDYDEYSWWVVVSDGINTTESDRWPFLVTRIETVNIISPKNNSLFIQTGNYKDLNITINWSGPDDVYNLCVQVVDNTAPAECSEIHGNSGVVTLRNIGPSARANEDYRIWVEHGTNSSEPIQVSYKHDMYVVSPTVSFFGMQGNELVCRGSVTALDSRAIGQTRNVSAMIVGDSNMVYDSLVVGDGFSYIETLKDEPSPGEYQCLIGLSLIDDEVVYAHENYSILEKKPINIPDIRVGEHVSVPREKDKREGNSNGILIVPSKRRIPIFGHISRP